MDNLLFVRLLSYIGSLVVFSMLVWTGRRFFKHVRARLYFFLLLSVFFYIFGYSQFFMQITQVGVAFWSRFQFLGIPYIPLFLVILAVHTRYYRQNQNLSPWLYLLAFIGLCIMLSQWSYPRLNLFYTDRTLSQVDGFLIVSSIDPGPVWYVHVVHTVAGLALSTYLFASAVRNARGKKRRDLLSMLIGIIIIGIVFLLFAFGMVPGIVDPLPIILAIISPLFVTGVFSDRLISDLSLAKINYFETSSNPVFIFNRDDQLIDLNDSAVWLISKSREKIINENWESIIEGVSETEDAKTVEVLDNSQEILIKNRIYSFQHTAFTDEKGRLRGYVRSLYDITEIKAAMKVLEEEARVDGLTGLLNRRSWEAQVEQTLKRGLRFRHPGSLLLLDLDHFKHINDTYGHQAGDAVLQEVSQRLKNGIRDIDILGRYGGEEICVWLVETCPEGAMLVAERLRRLIADAPVLYTQEHIRVTASIGVSGESEISTKDIGTYLKTADELLYQAKEAGRNCCKGLG